MDGRMPPHCFSLATLRFWKETNKNVIGGLPQTTWWQAVSSLCKFIKVMRERRRLARNNQNLFFCSITSPPGGTWFLERASVCVWQIATVVTCTQQREGGFNTQASMTHVWFYMRVICSMETACMWPWTTCFTDRESMLPLNTATGISQIINYEINKSHNGTFK